MSEKNAVIANLDMNVRAKTGDLEKNLKHGEGALTHFHGVTEKIAHGLKHIAAELKHVASHAAGTMLGLAGFHGFHALLDTFKELTVHQFETILQQEALGRVLGVSGNQLRAFGLAAERADLEQGALDMALTKTASSVTEGSDALNELKLSYQALRSMNVADQFLTILAAIEKLTSKNDQIRIAKELWGRGGAAILRASSEGFKQAGEDIKKFGLAIDEHGLHGIEKMHVAIVDLWARIKGISSQVLVGVSENATTWLDNISESFDKLGSQEIAKRVLSVMQSIRDSVVNALESIITALGGTEKAFLSFQAGMLRAQAFWEGLKTTSGGLIFDPDAARKNLEGIESRLHETEQRLKGMPDKDFHFGAAMHAPFTLPESHEDHEHAGHPIDATKNIRQTPFGSMFLGTFAKVQENILSGVLARMSRRIEMDVVKSSVPQSFSTIKGGTVEAARAIFEAERSYREGLNSVEERRHKESLEQGKRIEEAVNKGTDSLKATDL